MEIIKNTILEGKHDKPIVLDVFYNKNNKPKPIVIFCHGYKGFKDWGAWNLMAEAFARQGFFFIKFNFSYNGGTVTQPIDFPDLEAFGNNNYTKELDDLNAVIDWCTTQGNYKEEVDLENISLIGHSRGGGIVCIKAEEDNRITKVISLAGVSDFKRRTATTGDLENWKKTGVKYVLNGRTKQQMPHFYQFYEDFIQNEERLTIKRAVENLQKPFSVIHGNADTSVLIQEAYDLHSWNETSELKIIKDANHVFEAKHPWKEKIMPLALEEVVTYCVNFLSE